MRNKLVSDELRAALDSPRTRYRLAQAAIDRTRREISGIAPDGSGGPCVQERGKSNKEEEEMKTTREIDPSDLLGKNIVAIEKIANGVSIDADEVVRDYSIVYPGSKPVVSFWNQHGNEIENQGLRAKVSEVFTTTRTKRGENGNKDVAFSITILFENGNVCVISWSKTFSFSDSFSFPTLNENDYACKWL